MHTMVCNALLHPRVQINLKTYQYGIIPYWTCTEDGFTISPPAQELSAPQSGSTLLIQPWALFCSNSASLRRRHCWIIPITLFFLILVILLMLLSSPRKPSLLPPANSHQPFDAQHNALSSTKPLMPLRTGLNWHQVTRFSGCSRWKILSFSVGWKPFWGKVPFSYFLVSPQCLP